MNLYQFGELWGTALQDAGVVSCFYRQASYNQQFGEPSEGIGWGRRTDWGEAVPGQPWWVCTSFYGQSPAAGHKRFKKHRYGGNPFLHCWIWWVLFPESRIMPSLDLPSGYPSPRNDCVCWPPDRQTLFTQMNKINSPKKLKKLKRPCGNSQFWCFSKGWEWDRIEVEDHGVYWFLGATVDPFKAPQGPTFVWSSHVKSLVIFTFLAGWIIYHHLSWSTSFLFPC